MAQEGRGPDFIEALSRGLAVLRGFSAQRPTMSLSEVAKTADLARPTARRILLTLEELGYVRQGEAGYRLMPRVLELGMAYVSSLGLWEIARPHMEELIGVTGESSSMSQLDGSDIVYVARVAVPKIIALRVDIGTRFPAARTSQGKVLLAGLTDDDVAEVLAMPSRSGLATVGGPTLEALLSDLATVRECGYAVADEELAPGVRSVAVPVRDATEEVQAAMNVTVHAAETSLETLVGDYLPALQVAAARVSEDWVRWQRRPIAEDR